MTYTCGCGQKTSTLIKISSVLFSKRLHMVTYVHIESHNNDLLLYPSAIITVADAYYNDLHGFGTYNVYLNCQS